VVNQNPEQEGRDVALAKGGDQQAFERLYRDHYGRVYSLALRMTGGEWAEDLTQEVFVRAWQKLTTFREEAAFGTWLHRLAVNLLLSRRETLRRREKKQQAGGEFLERVAGRNEVPGVGMDLENAIQRLPDRARQVFVLYDVEGYPHAEIAQMMGIDQGTSKSQLHRARMMLREYLS
jgi:RNA polymerase sigma-70 factor (ECF subfamily)